MKRLRRLDRETRGPYLHKVPVVTRRDGSGRAPLSRPPSRRRAAPTHVLASPLKAVVGAAPRPIVYVCVNRRASDTCRRADLRGRHVAQPYILFSLPALPTRFFALLNFVSLRRVRKEVVGGGRLFASEYLHAVPLSRIGSLVPQISRRVPHDVVLSRCPSASYASREDRGETRVFRLIEFM